MLGVSVVLFSHGGASIARCTNRECLRLYNRKYVLQPNKTESFTTNRLQTLQHKHILSYTP